MSVNTKWIGISALLLVLVASGWIAGREFGGESARANIPAEAGVPPSATTSVEPVTTPAPLDTLDLDNPDTTVAGWFLPATEAEAALPRYDQVLNGISIGPGYHVDLACDAGPAYAGPRPASDLTFHFPTLTHPVEEAERRTDRCGETTVALFVRFSLPVDEADLARAARGEMDFFDAQHGGQVEIYRAIVETASVASSRPAESFEATTINGNAAVISGPVYPRGFGHSEAIVFNERTKVLTVIRAGHVSLVELESIVSEVAK